MGVFNRFCIVFLACAIAQVLVGAVPSGNEPMVAFICGKPAMHLEAREWVGDPRVMECWQDKKPILKYCQKLYPRHNITNVVEASYLVTIPGWPSLKGNPLHTHRVRPFRCIENSFQSDALLVPQHCKFDHQHNQKECKGFSHWEVAARDACAADGMHCESFGMLLNCGLGTFSGVEYVCCPNKVPTRMQPIDRINDEFDESEDDDEEEDDDSYDDDDDDEEEEDDEDDDSYDEDEDEDEDDEDYDSEEEEDDDDEDDDDNSWESEEYDSEDEDEDEELNVDKGGNLYELYLKGESMPGRYSNEHQKFVAAMDFMHKLQEAKNTQLMKEWTAAQDHVNQVRKSDPKTAEKLSKEITDRFQRLYSAYNQEDVAEKQQLVALHQQHVQADLKARKEIAMKKFLRALEKGDVMRVSKNLRGYIKAEEKDVMHTVNHYAHVKSGSLSEAAHIHARVIQHLKQCQTRIEQALEKLQGFPLLEREVRPQMEDFMKKFDDMALRIRKEVLPDPSASAVDQQEDGSEDSSEVMDNDSENEDESDEDDDNVAMMPNDRLDRLSMSEDLTGHLDDDLSDSLENDDEEDDEKIREDEHDYERPLFRPAHQLHSKMNVAHKGLQSSGTTTAQLGTTLAIAVGSVAVFIVLVVAVVMLRRYGNNQRGTNVTHGYVEVDPAASSEERHVANMQMNGYENPTYRYFEVQTTK